MPRRPSLLSQHTSPTEAHSGELFLHSVGAGQWAAADLLRGCLWGQHTAPGTHDDDTMMLLGVGGRWLAPAVWAPGFEAPALDHLPLCLTPPLSVLSPGPPQVYQQSV